MKSLLITVMTLVSLILMSGSAYSADFWKGQEAYDKGDFKTALAEWKPLAEGGYALAQFALGQMYYNGQGVLQHYKEAVRWYKLAAEQGGAEAQFNVGLMYYTGLKIAQDYKEAAKWFRLAAEQGYAKAQYSLGLMYATGQDVLKDLVYAHMWFNIASTNGYKEGAKNRVRFEKDMTLSQIAKAQELAKQCMKKKYKDC